MLIRLLSFVTFILSLIIFNYNNYSTGAEIYKSRTDIDKEYDYCENDILIYGDIEKGDYIKFIEIVREIKKAGCAISKVRLSSHGGDVFEAIEIGLAIRKNLISTTAPTYYPELNYVDCGGICLSGQQFNHVEHCNTKNWVNYQPTVCACDSARFLIWSAGVTRLNNALGLHRPYFAKKYFKGLSGSEAEVKYNELSEGVRKYLVKMNIPKDLIDEMFSHSSEEILYLHEYYKSRTDRKSNMYSDYSIPALKFVPFYQEWMNAKCGSGLYDEEQKT